MFAEQDELLSGGKLTTKNLANYYFGDFVLPPKQADIDLYWRNLKDGDDKPEFILFEERAQVDPYLVAQKIITEKLDWLDYSAKVFRTYPLAEEVYSTLENYRSLVFEAGNRKLKDPQGSKIEEFPVELLPFEIDKPYNLEHLVTEVIDEMFEGNFGGISSITWTEIPYKAYYGVYYPVDRSIRINLLLNSSQVPREVVKYIIYHELLHRDYQRHDADFREL